MRRGGWETDEDQDKRSEQDKRQERVSTVTKTDREERDKPLHKTTAAKFEKFLTIALNRLPKSFLRQELKSVEERLFSPLQRILLEMKYEIFIQH